MDDREKVLQDFLLDIDCLNELLPWTGRFNLFDVLKISKAEIRHSNVLAWLLDANENHGLGDAFIKGFMQQVVENDSNGKYDVFRLLLPDFYSFSVYREWKNIDLLLVSDNEEVAIAIENKVGSHEHSDQLNRYRVELEKTYPYYAKVFVFLTPDGEAPSDSENWTVFTYSDVLEILDEIRQSRDIAPDVAMMVDNYIDVIRRDIVDDQQIIEVCNRIYNKHKQALDLIFEHRLDSKNQISNVIRATLKELSDQEKIIYDNSTTDSWICFHTAEMDKLLPDLSTPNSSWSTNKVYYYWLSRSDMGFSAVFEIGGWHLSEEQNKNMQRMIDVAKPNDKKRENFRYKRLYSRRFEISDSEDISDSVRSQVIAAVDDMLLWESKLMDKLNEFQ